MVINKKIQIFSIFLFLLVISIPSQISAIDTTDFCIAKDPTCDLVGDPEVRFECRNNDTWRITTVRFMCADGSNYTHVFEELYLSGQCPYGGPGS